MAAEGAGERETREGCRCKGEDFGRSMIAMSPLLVPMHLSELLSSAKNTGDNGPKMKRSRRQWKLTPLFH